MSSPTPSLPNTHNRKWSVWKTRKRLSFERLVRTTNSWVAGNGMICMIQMDGHAAWLCIYPSPCQLITNFLLFLYFYLYFTFLALSLLNAPIFLRFHILLILFFWLMILFILILFFPLRFAFWSIAFACVFCFFGQSVELC